MEENKYVDKVVGGQMTIDDLDDEMMKPADAKVDDLYELLKSQNNKL